MERREGYASFVSLKLWLVKQIISLMFIIFCVGEWGVGVTGCACVCFFTLLFIPLEEVVILKLYEVSMENVVRLQFTV